MTPKRTAYVTNKELLREIHRSKNTYSTFLTDDDHQYDIILSVGGEITPDIIAKAAQNRVERQAKEKVEALAKQGIKEKISDHLRPVSEVDPEELVFRVMSWEHIPLAPGRKKNPKLIQDHYVRINFPPFQHFRMIDGELKCVGKSHWKNGLDNGEFSKDHGMITNSLALLFMKLCERYGTKGNWRGYCIDKNTEALTKDGWKNSDTISEQDTILSYNGDHLAWSSIKGIFRDNFDGQMHYLTSRGLDSLITPGHKILTGRGLIPVELLLSSDRVILMGEGEAGPDKATYSDSLVELAGWIVTEGCYDREKETGELRKIDIYQNPGAKADRIRNCLNDLGFKFSESPRGKGCITFGVCRKDSKYLEQLLPDKNLTMEFILSLTRDQRDLLITTMIDGDGYTRKNGNRSWSQKSKERIDMFVALCTLAGVKTNTKKSNINSFGKATETHTVNLFSDRGNTTRGACIDMHGGKRNNRGHYGRGKTNHQNQPTVEYKGTVWCPETEYGCFVARRSGKVYITGNSYNDEMKNQALLQLTQVGLQFDESKSENPFSYYTATMSNSFTRVLNTEKVNQRIRDDILEINSMSPSYTRQFDNSGKGTPPKE